MKKSLLLAGAAGIGLAMMMTVAQAANGPSPRDSAPADQNCDSPGKALYVTEAKFIRFGAGIGNEEAARPTPLSAECPFTRSVASFHGNAKPDEYWVRYLVHETAKGKGTLHVEYDLTVEKPGAEEGRHYGSFDAPFDISGNGLEEQLIDHKLDDKTLGWLRILVRYPAPGEHSF